MFVAVAHVASEGALRTYRAGAAVPLNCSPVDVPGERKQMGAGMRPEPSAQGLPRGLGQIGHCLDAHLVKLGGRLVANPPQRLDGQRMQELQLMFGIDDQQAVGLGSLGSDLGEELGPRHADRDRQPGLGLHIGPDASGDVRRRSEQMLGAAHIEERLVD